MPLTVPRPRDNGNTRHRLQQCNKCRCNRHLYDYNGYAFLPLLPCLLASVSLAWRSHTTLRITCKLNRLLKGCNDP